MKTIKAVGDKILVEFKTKEVKSSLVLPEGYSKETEDVAIVVSVGNLVEEVEAGDRVVFNPSAAVIIDILDKKYILLTEKAVVCIVKE